MLRWDEGCPGWFISECERFQIIAHVNRPAILYTEGVGSEKRLRKVGEFATVELAKKEAEKENSLDSGRVGG